jgi:hypothetical protein
MAGLLSLCSIASLGAQDTSWLRGRWELKHDDDGSPKDYLEFREGAEIVSISPDGRTMNGLYRVNGNDVEASFPLPSGKVLKLRMLANEKHQLTVKSARTGGVAVYERVAR